MATPYSVDLSYRTRSGRVGMLHLTSSDVAAAYYLSPSGSADIVLSPEDAKIFQMLYSTTPATTTTAKVYINGADTGIVLTGAANLATATLPQIRAASANGPGTEIQVPGGSVIKFVQV